MKAKKRKRDRSLSKLIDFPSIEAKEAAQKLADKENRDLKNWIETLIITAIKS